MIYCCKLNEIESNVLDSISGLKSFHISSNHKNNNVLNFESIHYRTGFIIVSQQLDLILVYLFHRSGQWTAPQTLIINLMIAAKRSLFSIMVFPLWSFNCINIDAMIQLYNNARTLSHLVDDQMAMPRIQWIK